MQSPNLYFLAIIPHGKVVGEVTAFKQHLAQHYHSHKALGVLPHITLKAPFKINAAHHEQVMAWFRQLDISIEGFTQCLDGFGAFNNKTSPVIYVQPATNASLEYLQEEIIDSFEEAFPAIGISYTEKHFAPHMTIAYRDLTPERFAEAWPQYEHQKYEAIFEVHSFYLLQHDGIKWHVIDEHALNKK
jgi:2'-5' RNA ligase